MVFKPQRHRRLVTLQLVCAYVVSVVISAVLCGEERGGRTGLELGQWARPKRRVVRVESSSFERTSGSASSVKTVK